ncbi:hypothetical protein HGRIS_008060 [Hohenbuehelia grisea]|uniref:WD repeat-containing protein 8 n=1 Tax=Hohenbuehelia grisea TaxID=104357 RepID=A0ABR3J7J6_9AGAR
MDFTEVYQQSASLVTFSNGAHFIANAVQNRLIVRRADTFMLTRTWLLDATPSPTHSLAGSSKSKPGPSRAISASIPPEQCITHIGWSCDSEYLLAACAKAGTVQVFALRDEDWSARIESGAEGLVKAEWAPDGRTILCFSEWGLRVTLWSLVSKRTTYIQFPIHPDRGYTFRADGRYFVLAERHKSKDTIGLYDAAEEYRLMRHFQLPTTSLASLSLSPTGNHLAVWEGPLEYKLHIFTLAGDKLASFSPEPDPGFGIRCAAWHPSGAFLAVGGYDDKIHILDSLSWGSVVALDISGRLPANTTLWREPSVDRVQGPTSIAVNRVDHSKAHPKAGTVQLDWNVTGSILMARFEQLPNAVYLYNFPSPAQAFAPTLRSVILLSQPVLHARWNPVRKGSLLICGGTGAMYTWSDEWIGENGEEEVAECIGVPIKKFHTKDARWAPDGKGMVLLDNDIFCCAFEVQNDASQNVINKSS